MADMDDVGDTVERADATGGANANDPANGEPEEMRVEAIRAGMAVYDARGDRLGSVENAELGKGYVEVKSGAIFTRALYVPLDAVARVDESGVHLKVAKRDLDKLDWYLPPTGGVDVDTPYSPSPWIETGYGQGTRRVPSGERARMVERDEQSGVQPPPPPDLAPGAYPDETHETYETTDTLPQALAPGLSEPGDGETTIAVPIVGEQLEARKRGEEAGAGSAHVRKDVRHEQQSLDVPVTHDELRVERVPVAEGGAAAGILGPDVFTEKDIDVPLMGEQVELEKRTRVTEEVVLRKRQITEQRTFSGDVRKERVWVEGTGGAEIIGADQAGAPITGERDISDEDTITYDRPAPGQEWPGTHRH